MDVVYGDNSLIEDPSKRIHFIAFYEDEIFMFYLFSTL